MIDRRVKTLIVMRVEEIDRFPTRLLYERNKLYGKFCLSIYKCLCETILISKPYSRD